MFVLITFRLLVTRSMQRKNIILQKQEKKKCQKILILFEGFFQQIFTGIFIISAQQYFFENAKTKIFLMATATNDLDSTIKEAQSFNQPKNVVEHCSIDISMVENVLLIWLDKNIDNQNMRCNHTVAQLRSVPPGLSPIQINVLIF